MVMASGYSVSSPDAMYTSVALSSDDSASYMTDDSISTSSAYGSVYTSSAYDSGYAASSAYDSGYDASSVYDSSDASYTSSAYVSSSTSSVSYGSGSSSWGSSGYDACVQRELFRSVYVPWLTGSQSIRMCCVLWSSYGCILSQHGELV